MSSSSLRAMFDLVADENDDFGYLIRRYAIDAAVDLQNADLSHLDFGELELPVLNLTGCNLDGANLSRVRSKIITEGAFVSYSTQLPLPSKAKRAAKLATEADPLERALLAVHRYHNGDWVVQQVLEHAEDSSSPIMVFYDSSPEQDYFTKKMCDLFRERSLVDIPSNSSGGIPTLGHADLIWFYTRSTKPGPLNLVPEALDSAFLQTFEETNPDHDVIAYPSKNHLKFRRIQHALRLQKGLNSRRSAFAFDLSKELARAPTVILFSGFPPISKGLYQKLRDRIRTRFKLIFLCPRYMQDSLDAEAQRWRKYVCPSFALSEQKTSGDDIAALKRRIAVATDNRVTVGTSTAASMMEKVASPMRELKAVLVNAINEAKEPRVWKNSTIYI